MTTATKPMKIKVKQFEVSKYTHLLGKEATAFIKVLGPQREKWPYATYRVKIVDIKWAWGRLLFKVKPLEGGDEAWVEKIAFDDKTTKEINA